MFQYLAQLQHVTRWLHREPAVHGQFSGGHDQDAFPDDARDAGAAGQLGTMLVADGGASGEEEVAALPVCYRYTGLVTQ